MGVKERLEAEWGIVDPEHIGDGAYIGRWENGVALFTTNGMTYTRPVCLGQGEIQSLINQLKYYGLISRTE